MAVAFRNIDVTPDDPVEEWGFEGMLAAVDRGSLREWRTIMRAVRADPFGDTADTLVEVLETAEDSGVVGALRCGLEQARSAADARDRQIVAQRMAELVQRSGLDQGTFARRIGTSRTRLNTYLTGRTTPSAAVLVRSERVAGLPSHRSV